MRLWTRINRWGLIRFLIFRIWRPLTSFFLSNLQALFYLHHRGKAIRDLRSIRSDLDILEDLTYWYHSHFFQWKSDPANGWIDYISKPWVSAYKNTGDCDDMMAIAHYVWKPHVDELHRACTYSATSGHCVMVARRGTKWYMASNQTVTNGYANPWDAVRSFYGVKTEFIYIYGLGARFFERITPCG